MNMYGSLIRTWHAQYDIQEHTGFYMGPPNVHLRPLAIEIMWGFLSIGFSLRCYTTKVFLLAQLCTPFSTYMHNLLPIGEFQWQIQSTSSNSLSAACEASLFH